MSQKIRDLVFQVHKWSGLATFLILLVAAATGCALTFREPLDAFLNPDLFAVSDSQPALPVSELVSRVEGQRPGIRVVLAVATPGPDRASVLETAPRDRPAGLGVAQLFADPATGRILGARIQKPGWDRRHILEGIYALHVRLMAGTPGRVLLGMVSGIWLVSSLLGVYLTLPRSGPFWRRWRAQWSVAWGARTPRLMLDLHRASGLWLFAGVLALSATGLFLNFYSEVSEPLAAALSPARFVEPAPREAAAGAPAMSYASAIRIAEAGLRADDRRLRLAVATFEPDTNLYRIGFSASGARDFAGLGPVYYYVDPQRGAVTARDNPYHDSLGRGALRALYPIHSGRMFGWPARLFIFATGLGTILMSVTGLYVWLRKQKARSASPRALAPAAEPFR